MVVLPPLLLSLMKLVGEVLIGRVEGGVTPLRLLEQNAAALVGRHGVRIVLVIIELGRWPVTPGSRPAAAAAAAHVGRTAAGDRTHIGLVRRHGRQGTRHHIRDGPGRPDSGGHVPFATAVGCCSLPTDAGRVGGKEWRRRRCVLMLGFGDFGGISV